jgi:hypothetical protein
MKAWRDSSTESPAVEDDDQQEESWQDSPAKGDSMIDFMKFAVMDDRE